MHIEEEKKNLRKILSEVDLWLADDATLEEMKKVFQKYYLPAKNGETLID